jgi:hypothetical protein
MRDPWEDQIMELPEQLLERLTLSRKSLGEALSDLAGFDLSQHRVSVYALQILPDPV